MLLLMLRPGQKYSCYFGSLFAPKIGSDLGSTIAVEAFDKAHADGRAAGLRINAPTSLNPTQAQYSRSKDCSPSKDA